MAERLLSTRELNRALLARQLLLERSRAPLTRALERVAGLQTQYAPSGYIGLWSRLHDFRRPALTRALTERRAVQATLMRATIHVVSARDYPVFAAGVRDSRREMWWRAYRKQVGDLDMEGVAEVLREYLRDGPRRQPAIVEFLTAQGFPRVAWSGVGLWLDMVRVPPSGTWEQRRANLYGLASEWLGDAGGLPPHRLQATEAEGLALLVRRYLAGFGPASLADLVSWSGVPARVLTPVVERADLRRFRDEHGGELLDVARAPLPGAEAPAPVRFLPTWDATLLVHARRTQILPEAYRPLVFHTKNPQSVPTFLVDGQVAGRWRYEGGKVRLDSFDPLPPAARRELHDEAERLAAFHREP